MQFLWRYIDDLVGKGLEMKVIAELLLYTSSSLVPMALPLAILMSSLMTFGNMGEFYELTAIKASGISLQRIMMPLVLLVVLISIGAFFFANDILPYTNLKMRSLLYDVTNQRPEISIIPGSYYNGIDGYSIRVEKKNPETNMMYNIMIYDHTQSRGNTSVTVADSGKMIVTADQRNLIFTIYNGHSYNELESERKRNRDRTYPHRYDKFEEQQFIIELVGFDLHRTDESLFKDHQSMLNLTQLEVMKDSIKDEIKSKQNVLYTTLVDGNYFRSRRRPARKVKQTVHIPDSITGMQRIDRIKKSVKKIQPKEIVDIKPEEEISEESTNLNPEFYANIMDNLTLKERDMIYESALSFARSARTYADGTAQTIDSKIKRLRRFEIEWHRKFTIAFACFVFLFIGAPLGAIIRKGGLGLPVVISTLFFIFYYISSLFGEKVVRESILPDYQGMWITSSLFFTIGIFLTYKATTDAAMLNLDTYANFFRKLNKRKKRTLIEGLQSEITPQARKEIRPEILNSTLNSLLEWVKDNIAKVNQNLTWMDFTLSLLSMQSDSDIILFERLYRNTVKSIANSKLYDIPSIKAKLMQYPDFSTKDFTDHKFMLVIKFIMLALPPLTLIVGIRHFIRLLNLKARLRTIYQVTEELKGQIIIHGN
jgi:lipopolysaccharide export system permease protein